MVVWVRGRGRDRKVILGVSLWWNDNLVPLDSVLAIELRSKDFVDSAFFSCGLRFRYAVIM
jgi:hypothetical protein